MRAMIENTVELIFTVENIIFKSDQSDFCIIRGKSIKIESGENKSVNSYIFRGNFLSVNRGDKFKAKCNWVYNKYGWQLDVIYSRREITKNSRSIRKFLVKNIPGIGPVCAKNLVDNFGADTFDIIKNHPEKISAVKGIGEKRGEEIRQSVARYFSLDELSNYLFQNKFTNYEYIMKIYEKYQEDALSMVKDNPYCIIPALPFNAFPLIDALAISSGYLTNDSIRLGKIILYYLGYRAYKGDAFVFRSDIYKDMYYFMQNKNISVHGVGKVDIDNALRSLSRSSQIIIDVDSTEKSLSLKDKVYLTKYCILEDEIVNILDMKNIDKNIVNDKQLDEFFNSYEAEMGIRCSVDQKRAVKFAAEKGLMVLTGLPGAGKTSTVNAIIAFIKHNDPDKKIVMCAPSARASKRITELTGMPAYTIHRLLGIRGDEYTSEDIEPISSDYLIVDECSMVDLQLFHALLTSIKDSECSLIIVGDKNQLPPVGIGFPFREIIDAGCYPTVRLTELFRQAAESQINKNANSILLGEDSEMCCNPEKQDFFMFPEKRVDKAVELVVDCYRYLIEYGGEKADDIMVLSAMMDTPLGAMNLNKIIQDLRNPLTEGKIHVQNQDYDIRENDRVMQIKNNYDKNIFNGDIGKVVRIDKENSLIYVEYDDFEVFNTEIIKSKKKVCYLFEELTQIIPAYCMTIHKSQGSEFPCVIIPISEKFTNLSRNLLYTAVTRAKKRDVIVGDMDAFYSGIKNVEISSKNSGLLDKIRARRIRDEKESSTYSREKQCS